MHTDEYEISLAREINVCERVINRTQAKLVQWQQRFGMDYPHALEAVAAGSLIIDAQEFAAWQDDFEALPQWEQRLEQYREALSSMRISVSRF